MSFTDDNKDDTALTVEMTNKADTTFISDLQRKLCNCFYAHPLQQKENVFYSNGYFIFYEWTNMLAYNMV